MRLATGAFIDAELVVWAAGVKAPDVLKELDGLETNRINQLIVLPTLQTTRDENIFAFGDCAACPWIGPEVRMSRPAHRPRTSRPHIFQADQAPSGRSGTDGWRYRDFGSLVSLGEYSTVGNLMGGFMGGSLWVEGLFARLMYRSLYKMHETRCMVRPR